VYYNYDEYITKFLVEAANCLKIKTVEMQHGMIDSDMVWYTNLEKRKFPCLPQYYLSFGQVVVDTVDMDLVKVYEIGKYSTDVKLIKKQNKAVLNNEILFVSYADEKLVDIAIELNKRVPEYDIIIKMHPVEYGDWKERYPKLLHTNIRVIDHGHYSMFDLIAKSHIIIGTESTGLLEAVPYRKPIYIYKENNNHVVIKAAVNRRAAFEFYNIEELITGVKKQQEMLSDDGIDYFWTSGYEANVRKAINQIMTDKRAL
jgi:hypothetical protein